MPAETLRTDGRHPGQHEQLAPLLIDEAEAARLLSVCRKTLWSLTAPWGPIPCVRLGLPGSRKPAVRYSLEALRAYIAQAEQQQLKIAEV